VHNDSYLSEQFVHLAAITVLCLALFVVMFIAQEVIPEEWVVDQAL
jgi:hypothetical protein